jgi:UDP:flavonoid glycosyltransferase YjiC (YdhE family)
MANFLFVWELGGNLGHLMQFLPIAQELRRQGHHVVFALRELSALEHCEAAVEFPVLQSPRWLPRLNKAPEDLAYSDILLGAGYLSAAGVQTLVTAWRYLFQLTCADLVICDHAPTAVLAARVDKRRAIAIGTGFTCPPAQAGLPHFAVLSRQQLQQVTAREIKTLNVCNTILQKSGARRLQKLAELFADLPILLCTYPELDHYGVRDSVDYLGPIYTDVAMPAPQWPQRYQQNILVYLNNFMYWDIYIAAFQAVQANFLIAAVGISAEKLKQCTADHITVVDYPIGLQTVLAHADLVVCHGGHGTVATALMAAKPLLILPMQKEQGLMALRIAEHALGSYWSGGDVASLIGELRNILSDRSAHAAVQAFAEKYADNTVASTVNQIVARLINVATVE